MEILIYMFSICNSVTQSDSSQSLRYCYQRVLTENNLNLFFFTKYVNISSLK